METITSIVIGVIAVLIVLALFEYRLRKPDVLVLYERQGNIDRRKGLIYPRHFSLPLKRTAHPIQINMESTASGNLMVNIKLVGSVAPSLEHLSALIRAGGWNEDAVANAAEEAQVILQSLTQNYTEQFEVQDLSSSEILNHLNQQTALISEKLGLDVISLGVLSLEPADPDITYALRQQEEARLMEQTEKLNNQARAAAAREKYKTDEEIAAIDHTLELKKAQLKKELIEEEATLANQRLEHELARKRMQLAFEKEEVEVLKGSPELLMLTPQAARLAEASQNLKNARTVISLTPQDLANGSELLDLFQDFLGKALETKRSDQQTDEA
ncbi:MAG TPA: hypothetical protein VJ965_09915 [Anaerolineales bacterium]|nr:hypothetical protein [Anaerolineales bacterium]